MTGPDLPEKLSASQVTLILQRAAEIDARGDSLSPEELSQIAAEAGIDPVATRTAILEILAEEGSASPTVAPPAPEAPASRWAAISHRRILTGVAVGFVVGLFNLDPNSWMGNAYPIPVDASPLAPAAGILAIIYLVFRAVQAMKRGRQLDFQLQNFATWYGMILSVLLLGDPPWVADFALEAVLSWIVTSLLGGLLVRFGPREGDSSEDRSGVAPASP